VPWNSSSRFSSAGMESAHLPKYLPFQSASPVETPAQSTHVALENVIMIPNLAMVLL